MIDKLSESKLSRLELEWQGGSLKLDKTSGYGSLSGVPSLSPSGSPAAPLETADRRDFAAGSHKDSAFAGPAAVAEAEEAGSLFCSPLVGTCYLAPSPEAEPYVQVGQEVKKGQTLCLIEAMKVMSEIPAPKDGTVLEVLAENGALVGFDQPLFRLRWQEDV